MQKKREEEQNYRSGIKIFRVYISIYTLRWFLDLEYYAVRSVPFCATKIFAGSLKLVPVITNDSRREAVAKPAGNPRLCSPRSLSLRISLISPLLFLFLLWWKLSLSLQIRNIWLNFNKYGYRERFFYLNKTKLRKNLTWFNNLI